MKKTIRLLSRFLLLILAAIGLIGILMLLPSVQQGIARWSHQKFLVQKGIHQIKFERVSIRPSGRFYLRGFTFTDSNSDTLYIDELKGKISIAHLWIRQVYLRSIELQNAQLNYLLDASGNTNFDEFLQQFPPSDSTSPNTPMSIKLGKIKLANIQGVYTDSVAGISISIDLGKIELNLANSRFASQWFDFGKARIENTRLSLTIFTPSATTTPDPDPESATRQLPIFHAQNLRLDQFSFSLLSQSLHPPSDTNLQLEAFFNKLEGRKLTIDISQKLLAAGHIEHTGTLLSMVQKSSIDSTERSHTIPRGSIGIGWNFALDAFEGKNTRLNLTQLPNPQSSSFPQRFPEISLNYSIDNLVLNDSLQAASSVGFEMSSDTLFTSISGLNLARTFSKIGCQRIALSSRKSELLCEGVFQLKPKSDSSGIPLIDSGNVKLNASLDPQEILELLDMFSINPLADSLWPDKKISASLQSSIFADTVHLESFSARVDNQVYLQLQGQYIPLQYPKGELQLKLDTFVLIQSKHPAYQVLDPFIPDMVWGNAFVNGTTDNLAIDFYAEGPQCSLKSMASVQSTDSLTITLNELNIVHWPLLTSNITIRADGHFSMADDWPDASGSIHFVLDSLTNSMENVYDIEGSGKLHQQKITAHLEGHRPNLIFQAFADGMLTNDSLDLTYHAAIQHLILPLKERSDFSFEGTTMGHFVSTANGEIKIVNTLADCFIVKANKKYRVETIQTLFKRDSLSLYLSNSSANHNLMFYTESNPSQLKEVLTESIYAAVFNHKPEKNLPVIKIEANIGHIENLLDFLPFQDDTLRIDTILFRLDNLDNKLDIQTHVQSIGFNGIHCGSLKLNTSRKKNNREVTLNLNDFVAKSIKIDSITFNNFLFGSSLVSELNAYQDKKLSTHLKFETIRHNDTLYSSICDSVLLFTSNWQAVGNNTFIFAIPTKQFSLQTSLKSGQQLMQMNFSAQQQSVHLSNFELSQLPLDKISIRQGNINAAIVYNNKGASPDLQASFSSTSIKVDTFTLGNITGAVNYNKQQGYNAAFSLKNTTDKLSYKGTQADGTANEGLQHHLQFDLRNISIYSKFIPLNDFSIASGHLKGNLEVQHSHQQFDTRGEISLSDVSVAYIPYNSILRVKNEQLNFAGRTIYVNNFEVLDEKDNQLNINGTIEVPSQNNYQINLMVGAKDFIIVDAPEQPDADLYGKLVLSTHTSIQGSIAAPKIKTEIQINPQTDLTYVMEGSSLEVQSPEGIVVFVDDVESPDSLRLEKEFNWLRDTVSNFIEGIDLDAIVKFDPKSKYRIITNPQSGDFASFNLMGSVGYRYHASTEGALTGRIEFEKGLYRLSFYNMIQKEFTIRPGSEIVFSGSLRNTLINIKAANTIRTNSVALLATDAPMMSANEKEMYNRRLPYEVVFALDGALMNPTIGFGLDLPETYRAEYPTINAKLKKLEGPDMEHERNTQVFALLVTGNFMPENTNSGLLGSGSMFATSAALNSVNGILTHQLNNFTNQYVRIVDLQFDLKTYEDHQSSGSELATNLDIQLSKKLFNERVTVNIESSVNIDSDNTNRYQGQSSYNTDFTVIYNITPDGTYRVKAFSVNKYDYLYGADIINSGIGFIFTREIKRKEKSYLTPQPDSLLNDQ